MQTNHQPDNILKYSFVSLKQPSTEVNGIRIIILTFKWLSWKHAAHQWMLQIIFKKAFKFRIAINEWLDYNLTEYSFLNLLKTERASVNETTRNSST